MGKFRRIAKALSSIGSSLSKKNNSFEDYDDYYEDEDEEYDFEDDIKSYYGSVPSGCQACGGPYPLCCDSCPAFDD